MRMFQYQPLLFIIICITLVLLLKKLLLF